MGMGRRRTTKHSPICSGEAKNGAFELCSCSGCAVIAASDFSSSLFPLPSLFPFSLPFPLALAPAPPPSVGTQPPYSPNSCRTLFMAGDVHRRCRLHFEARAFVGGGAAGAGVVADASSRSFYPLVFPLHACTISFQKTKRNKKCIHCSKHFPSHWNVLRLVSPRIARRRVFLLLSH